MVRDLSPKGCSGELILSEFSLDARQLALQFRQFTLERQRALLTRLTSRHRDVMESLARGREEEGLRKFEC